MYTIVSNFEIKIAEKIISFPCRIKKNTDGVPAIIEINNLVIVVFKPYEKSEWDQVKSRGTDMNRNIWAFNQAGDLVWQVAPCMPGHEGLFVYDGVFFKDGRLLCGNAGMGRDYELNPVDGSVKRYPDHPVRSW